MGSGQGGPLAQLWYSKPEEKARAWASWSKDWEERKVGRPWLSCGSAQTAFRNKKQRSSGACVISQRVGHPPPNSTSCWGPENCSLYFGFSSADYMIMIILAENKHQLVRPLFHRPDASSLDGVHPSSQNRSCLSPLVLAVYKEFFFFWPPCFLALADFVS